MEAATFSATGPGEPFDQALERVWVRREVGGGGGKSACQYVDALSADSLLELAHRVGPLITAKRSKSAQRSVVAVLADCTLWCVNVMGVDFARAFDNLKLDLIVQNHKDPSARSMQVLHDLLEADGDWLDHEEKLTILWGRKRVSCTTLELDERCRITTLPKPVLGKLKAHVLHHHRRRLEELQEEPAPLLHSSRGGGSSVRRQWRRLQQLGSCGPSGGQQEEEQGADRAWRRARRQDLLPCLSFAVQFSRLGAVHGAAGGRRSVANGAAAGLDHGYKPLPTRIIRLRRAAAQQLLNRGASRSAGGSFRRSEAEASLGRQRRRRQRASVLYSTCSRYYSRCSTSARRALEPAGGAAALGHG